LKKPLFKIYRKLYSEFGPQHWWPGDTAFEIIIGAILTQNTAWSNVEKAIGNLKKRGLLSSKKLSRTKPAKIAHLIKPSGYYNIKTRRLLNFLDYLNAEHEGKLNKLLKLKMPALRKRLLEINGIGPETADSILLYAADRPIFVVDAYTRRIFSRHHMIKKDASYDHIQRFFMSNLPRDIRLYNEYHALIVRTGKEFCRKNPKCGACPLNEIFH
jgi:endonuclease-3 related protein